MSLKENALYKTVCDTFTIPDMCEFKGVMVFNNGIKSFSMGDGTNVRVGYGVRVSYTNKNSCTKTVTSYSEAMFFVVGEEIGETPVARIDGCPETECCGKTLKVCTKICLETNGDLIL